jgi:hypothetical protein
VNPGAPPTRHSQSRSSIYSAHMWESEWKSCGATSFIPDHPWLSMSTIFWFNRYETHPGWDMRHFNKGG